MCVKILMHWARFRPFSVVNNFFFYFFVLQGRSFWSSCTSYTIQNWGRSNPFGQWYKRRFVSSLQSSASTIIYCFTKWSIGIGYMPSFWMELLVKLSRIEQSNANLFLDVRRFNILVHARPVLKNMMFRTSQLIQNWTIYLVLLFELNTTREAPVVQI